MQMLVRVSPVRHMSSSLRQQGTQPRTSEASTYSQLG